MGTAQWLLEPMLVSVGVYVEGTACCLCAAAVCRIVVSGEGDTWVTGVVSQVWS